MTFYTGNYDTLKDLINRSIYAGYNPVNLRGDKRKTALHLAAAGGKSKTVQERLDPSLLETPEAFREIVKFLCENHADMRMVNKNGMTALHHAASWGKFKNIEPERLKNLFFLFRPL